MAAHVNILLACPLLLFSRLFDFISKAQLQCNTELILFYWHGIQGVVVGPYDSLLLILFPLLDLQLIRLPISRRYDSSSLSPLFC